MNWDYIAGFFDGEGSISTNLRKDRSAGYGFSVVPTFQISQKNRAILDEIEAFMEIDSSSIQKWDRAIKDSVSIRFSQRSYALRIHKYDGLQIVCNNLMDKVHVKKEQMILLQRFIDIKKGIRYKSFSKETMIELLRLCKRISQCSVKGNLNFQAKVDRMIEQVKSCTWTPEARYAKMSLTRKKHWQEIHAGRKKWPNFSHSKLYDPYLQTIKDHPDQLLKTLQEARKKLTNGTYFRFQKQALLYGSPILILPDAKNVPTRTSTNGSIT